MSLLTIKNLHATIGDKPILEGINLTVNAGETHAIMGPNGAGKSTLSHLLAGRDGYEISAGTIQYDGRDLLSLAPHERACEGLFLAFQYPVEIPGVNITTFMRHALNAKRRYHQQEEYDNMAFVKRMRALADQLNMPSDMLKRQVNVGFSGGEKKRCETLQMALLEPKLAILDETDSGLDIDALKIVSEGVNALRNAQSAFLVITHYQRLLNYIIPDYVHILADGKIVKSGDYQLAHQLEEKGYAAFVRENVA